MQYAAKFTPEHTGSRQPGIHPTHTGRRQLGILYTPHIPAVGSWVYIQNIQAVGIYVYTPHIQAVDCWVHTEQIQAVGSWGGGRGRSQVNIFHRFCFWSILSIICKKNFVKIRRNKKNCDTPPCEYQRVVFVRT